uniref:Interferon-induced protein 44-like n=1 Tax=Astyanax mexicanus TaxID=7994 RepID=A0A3B1IBZ8_ASTMX
MGGQNSKPPEFLSVLANKQVKVGEKITLQCKTNIEKLSATWKKNDQKLMCVEGKHTIRNVGTTFILEIENAEETDEGKYTLILEHEKGSGSCSAMVIVELNEWRRIDWEQEMVIRELKSFKISNDSVKELRFLLCGPIGSGKSSVINSIKTVFENRQFINCLAASEVGQSFSEHYRRFTVGSGKSGCLPFAFYDVMGLEAGDLKGVRTDDIIKALKGHVPAEYKFHPLFSITEDNKHYIRSPSVNDKIHCLVNVVPADKITLVDQRVIQKMADIREAASRLRIPQVVLMTKVDKTCLMTKADLSKIYRSRKIREKMLECSVRLGVPMNCIFPIKSYHDETQLDPKINCLILNALRQMILSANDYVEPCSGKLKYAD